ncbi:hypothetical protein GGU10DRAFT_355646, partial [Lentinula aff. detonsa]
MKVLLEKLWQNLVFRRMKSLLLPNDSDPSAECYTVPVDEVRSAIEESKLGFNPDPDLFLIHSSDVVARSDLKKSWQILEQMKDTGEPTEIGVSNFHPQDLELVLYGGKHKPAV